MTDRASELEAALRISDSDGEIGNATVGAATFSRAATADAPP
jgi:hypothetical protein